MRDCLVRFAHFSGGSLSPLLLTPRIGAGCTALSPSQAFLLCTGMASFRECTSAASPRRVPRDRAQKTQR